MENQFEKDTEECKEKIEQLDEKEYDNEILINDLKEIGKPNSNKYSCSGPIAFKSGGCRLRFS